MKAATCLRGVPGRRKRRYQAYDTGDMPEVILVYGDGNEEEKHTFDVEAGLFVLPDEKG